MNAKIFLKAILMAVAAAISLVLALAGWGFRVKLGIWTPGMLVARGFCAPEQPLLQITAPANNSLATEGTTITITVAADSSVQIVGVIAESPLPDVQGTSSPNQFTLTLPINIPPGLYKLTAVGTNASGDVES